MATTMPHTTAFDTIGSQPRMSLDRPSQAMSYELTNDAKAHLDDGQYVVGYSFLNTLLTTHTSISTPAKRYDAPLPPAPVLALASTLIVYPQITTKAKLQEKQKGADAALRYLQNVQRTISPTDDLLRRAFAFPGHSRRRGERSPSSEDEADRLSCPPAMKQSLWNLATDFWHILGWAFNCSVLHKKRWERWRLWLEVMLDFIEADWKARLRRSKQGGTSKEKKLETDTMLKESMIWHYISSQDPSIRENRRRMVRAILARGEKATKTQFSEIWTNETAGPKISQTDKEHVAEIDIENGILGEFRHLEENETMHDAPPSAVRISPRAGKPKKAQAAHSDSDDSVDSSSFTDQTVEDAIERLGGIESVTLRQRFIALLAHVADALPEDFTKVDDFFDHIAEDAPRLPIMLFSVLISTSQLPGRMQMHLNANLLLPLVHMNMTNYDFTTLAEPTQAHLEFYLPYKSTTQSYAANAKISLIVEQMFLHMMSVKGLQATDRLRETLEEGVKKRSSVYGTAQGRKGNAKEEEQASAVLEACSARLLGLLEVVEMMGGKAPQPREGRNNSFVSDLSLSDPPSQFSEDEE